MVPLDSWGSPRSLPLVLGTALPDLGTLRSAIWASRACNAAREEDGRDLRGRQELCQGPRGVGTQLLKNDLYIPLLELGMVRQQLGVTDLQIMRYADNLIIYNQFSFEKAWRHGRDMAHHRNTLDSSDK